MNISIIVDGLLIALLVIFTTVKLVLLPILAYLTVKLRVLYQTVKKYGFSRNPKLEPICIDLPDDVMVNILSKLDIVSLRRCTLALSLDRLLPRIESISTPLLNPLVIRDESRVSYDKFLNELISKSFEYLFFLKGRPLILGDLFSRIIWVLTMRVVAVFIWLNAPQFRPTMIDFFKGMTGLKSLEVELPSMPCYECEWGPEYEVNRTIDFFLKSLEVEVPSTACFGCGTRRGTWFKWDARYGVDDKIDYGLYVFGERVENSEEDVRARRRKQIWRMVRTAFRHTMFHGLITEFGFEGNTWKTGISLTTNDVDRNGGLVVGSWWWKGGGKVRIQVLHLASTLKFNHIAKGEKDVMLMFITYDKTDQADDDDNFDIITDGDNWNIDDELLRACLDDTDDKKREANRRTELKHIVTQILDDDDCRNVFSAYGSTPRS